MRNRILASLERAAASEMPDESHKRITFALAQAALQAGAQRGVGGPPFRRHNGPPQPFHEALGVVDMRGAIMPINWRLMAR